MPISFPNLEWKYVDGFWIVIQNFKAIHALTCIELRPLTIVAGANSSGKSTLLDAISLLGEISRSGSDRRLRAIERSTTFQDLYGDVEPGDVAPTEISCLITTDSGGVQSHHSLCSRTLLRPEVGANDSNVSFEIAASVMQTVGYAHGSLMEGSPHQEGYVQFDIASIYTPTAAVDIGVDIESGVGFPFSGSNYGGPPGIDDAITTFSETVNEILFGEKDNGNDFGFEVRAEHNWITKVTSQNGIATQPTSAIRLIEILPSYWYESRIEEPGFNIDDSDIPVMNIDEIAIAAVRDIETAVSSFFSVDEQSFLRHDGDIQRLIKRVCDPNPSILPDDHRNEPRRLGGSNANFARTIPTIVFPPKRIASEIIARKQQEVMTRASILKSIRNVPKVEFLNAFLGKVGTTLHLQARDGMPPNWWHNETIDASDNPFLTYAVGEIAEFAKAHLSKIAMVGPVRGRGMLSDSVVSSSGFVAPTGWIEQLRVLLLQHVPSSDCSYPLPDFDATTVNFRESLMAWMRYLELAEDVRISPLGRIEVLRQVVGGEGAEPRWLSLSNVGSGVSQLLPILVTVLASDDTLVCVEQPEIHLHPRAQIRIADFFYASVIAGRRVVVETHSDHILHRIRRHEQGIRLKNNSHDSISSFVFVSQQDGETKFEVADPSDADVSSWPKGFLDTAIDELEDWLSNLP